MTVTTGRIAAPPNPDPARTDAYVEAYRQTLPVADPLRHDLDPVDTACARLAPGWNEALAAPPADVAQLAVTIADSIFRRNHGPEHTWSRLDLIAYDALMDAVFQRATGDRQ